MCRSPDQLILMDDPAFLPETALPALDFDLSSFELRLSDESQRSSQSMMSIHGRSPSNSTSQAVGSLQVPSSSTQAGAHQLPLEDPFISAPAQRLFGSAERDLFDDEGDYFQDDMIFEFDANGEMRDIDVNDREARRAASVNPRGRIRSDSGACGRVRKENDNATSGQIFPTFDAQGDFDMVNIYDDGLNVLPEAEPFPMMSGALGGNDKPQPLIAPEDRVYQASSEVLSSITADAPLNFRKTRSRRTLPADQMVELRNSDLMRWQTEYKSSMAAGALLALQRKANSLAKNNAYLFVCGTGLNCVGNGIGASKIPSPLEMFSGEKLLAKITRPPLPSEESRPKRETRRARDVDRDQQITPKRARQGGFEDEIGRGNFDDDQGLMMMEDVSVGMEVGRDAPSALPDYPSSALMPWNVSASLNSYQKGATSSLKGRDIGSQAAGSTGRRPLSASPLVGRGSALPGPLEHFQDDDIIYDHDDFSHGLGRSLSQAEFEIFGPAAQVDTQTAGDSQWVRDALEREAGNFFEYVLNSISEKAVDGHGEDELQAGVAGKDRFVTFEELFDPARNSRIVAAQAFYHVLSLVTKRRVWVEQSLDGEQFGPIRVGVVG
jgi:meiotic recombination protein REC8, fungi type